MHRRFVWFALLLILFSCKARPRRATNELSENSARKNQSEHIAEYDLASGVSELGQARGLFDAPETRSYLGLVRDLAESAENPDVRGAFVKIGTASFDLSQSEELGELLSKFRKKNKPVVCHAHTLTNASAHLVLRGCSRIWLSPAGQVVVTGIAAQLVYFRQILDRFKVGVEFLAMGRFKSGPEPFTREGPSPAARENLQETLASMREAWLAAVRGTRSETEQYLEDGPFSPESAKSRGLIDELGFERDAKAEARKLADNVELNNHFGGSAAGSGGFAEILRQITNADDGKMSPHVAVVPAEGAISMEAGGPLGGGSGITAHALIKTLKRLRENEQTKAVVLRLDSPGGSPLASDLIWAELIELKKTKPVVVSVGNMAASGGYYIACAANRIFAQPSSIVGSIGVFGGKLVFANTLEQIGIRTVTIPANPKPGAAERATFGSPLSPWDDATRARMQEQMQSTYDLFLKRVAESRNLPLASIAENAEGRIWSGTQGLQIGLIDQLGGLHDALLSAKKLAQLPEDAPTTLEGTRESLLELLLLGEGASDDDVAAALRNAEMRPWLGKDLPVQLRPFAAALSPMFANEHVLAIMPYALTIE